MTAIADRRENGIRTRNRPAVPGAPFISDLERAAAGGVATLDETSVLIPTNQLGTGAPDATKALFGDQTWQAAATAAALAAEIAARTVDVDAEEAARIAADAAHIAAADPHVQYQRESEKDSNNGYLGADANARLTSTRLSMSATDKLVGRSTAGAGASEEVTCTAAGRAIIDDADAAAQRTTLGLGTLATKSSVGTGDLDNDAVTYPKIQNVSATDKVLGRSTAGAGDIEEIACTAAGRALIDDADAAAQRATLALGTLALLNIGDTITSDANALPNMSNNGRSYTIANNGTQDIGPLASGIIVIYDSGTTAGLAIIGINSTTCKVLAETIANVFTITSGTGSRINVFFSGATATGVRIENKLGGSTTVRVLVFRLQ